MDESEMVLVHTIHGNLTVSDLRKDVAAWKKRRMASWQYGFTAETVESLLNRIVELENRLHSL